MKIEHISAVIVEDEPLARQTIKDFVQGQDWLKIVGEAADGDSAVTLIDELRPDLVFLDVRMPGLTGLQVLENIKHDPEVVFTTAYDDHAVTAFELEALDYILKPFGRERFRQMLARVKLRLVDTNGNTEPSIGERAQQALQAKPVEYLVRLFVRDRAHQIERHHAVKSQEAYSSRLHTDSCIETKYIPQLWWRTRRRSANCSDLEMQSLLSESVAI